MGCKNPKDSRGPLCLECHREAIQKGGVTGRDNKWHKVPFEANRLRRANAHLAEVADVYWASEESLNIQQEIQDDAVANNASMQGNMHMSDDDMRAILQDRFEACMDDGDVLQPQEQQQLSAQNATAMSSYLFPPKRGPEGEPELSHECKRAKDAVADIMSSVRARANGE